MRFRTLSGSIPSPAAGQGFTFQFSPIERVRLYSLIFEFQTDATVANRSVYVELQDPNGTPVFVTGPTSSQAASSLSTFVVSPVFSGPVNEYAINDSGFGLGWPQMWMPPGWQIFVNAHAIDAGDQFTVGTFAADYSEDVWHQNQDAAALAAYLQTLA